MATNDHIRVYHLPNKLAGRPKIVWCKGKKGKHSRTMRIVPFHGYDELMRHGKWIPNAEGIREWKIPATPMDYLNFIDADKRMIEEAENHPIYSQVIKRITAQKKRMQIIMSTPTAPKQTHGEFFIHGSPMKASEAPIDWTIRDDVTTDKPTEE